MRTRRAGRVFGPLAALAFLIVTPPTSAGDGNRLAHLNEPPDPYRVGLSTARLTTPQWVGEPGVEAVVILAIDDLTDNAAKYEAYLRPILDRLKAIDGRAALSVMACRVPADDPTVARWLAEGVSIEAHTLEHPCPLLQGGHFAKAATTYHECLDRLAAIPGAAPVAFRMPCCDSINSLTPRFFDGIMDRPSPGGRTLAIDSSVFCLLTSDDPSLPRSLVQDADGGERFGKYLPFPAFVNTVENHPFPYLIGTVWEFPCIVPSDWEAQNLHKPNNPRTVEDLKAALDAVVLEQGVMNLVFHPHGWIENRQIVELIDHAQAKHGQRVKFLTFREALERINAHLLDGTPARSPDGQDQGVRLADVDDDGFEDVLIGHPDHPRFRLWKPAEGRWQDGPLPLPLVEHGPDGRLRDVGVRIGLIPEPFPTEPRPGTPPPIRPVLFVRTPNVKQCWQFDGTGFRQRLGMALPPLRDEHDRPIFTAVDGRDRGVRFRDIDGDGATELIVANDAQNEAFVWINAGDDGPGWIVFDGPQWMAPLSLAELRARNTLLGGYWARTGDWRMPGRARVVDAEGRDAGTRWVDVDEDGRDDVVLADESGSSIHLARRPDQEDWEPILKTDAGTPGNLRPIVQEGRSNGFWAHTRSLVWQNEDTSALPHHIERRPFAELLQDDPPGDRTVDSALASFHLRPGFTIECVASEPLVEDPVAFDWSADGRLWVVEMGDYPLGGDGKGSPDGSVKVLTDDDGDGVYDRAETFLDGLSFPNGIAPHRDGVLITCAPDILFARDTDGDDRADEVTKLYTGFAESNPQHRANGFAWGLDGWFQGADGDSDDGITSTRTGKKVPLGGRDFRIHPDTGAFELEVGRGQFGRRRDDWGNWFANDNSTWTRHVVLSESQLRRNPFLALAVPFVVLEPDRRLYPTSPIVARFNDLDNAGLATSANSPEPYRDDLFGPAFASSLFVSEPVHNLVHRLVLAPDGASYTGRRAPGEADREFLSSSDPWFRPTQIKTGPDGALYIADMYRAVIEHPSGSPTTGRRSWI